MRLARLSSDLKIVRGERRGPEPCQASAACAVAMLHAVAVRPAVIADSVYAPAVVILCVPWMSRLAVSYEVWRRGLCVWRCAECGFGTMPGDGLLRNYGGSAINQRGSKALQKEVRQALTGTTKYCVGDLLLT